MRRKNNLLGMHGRSTDEDERSALLRIQHSKSVLAVVLAVVIALSVVAGAGVAMAGGTDGHGNGADNGDGDGDGASDGNGDDGDMAGATEIDECTVIDKPGSYVLTEDVEDSDADVCIDIQSSDVHFDGNGHLIEGDLPRSQIEEDSQGVAPRTRVGVGVNAQKGSEERIENVTTEDYTVTNWYHGALAENTSDSTTTEATAHDNGGGIIYDNSSNVTVTDSNSSNNVILGIITDSRAGVSNANNVVADNTAQGNGFFGVAVFVSNNTTIEGNDLSDNTLGILAYGTTDSTIVDNTVTNNSLAGLALDGDQEPVVEEPVDDAEPRVPEVNVSRDNVITGNDFSESGFAGVAMFNATNTYFADNDVSDTRGTAPFPIPGTSSGLLLDNSTDNAIVSNDASGNNGTGISLVNSSDNNLFVDNDASDNAEDGFTVNGSENVALIGNTANDNGDDGVEVTDSNGVVLLLNELEGNGDQAVEINDSENVIRLNSVEDVEELLSEVLDS